MNVFNLDSSNGEKWSELLRQAVSQPGLMLKAYSAFHGYSPGNQLAALMQCNIRGIEPGPIDTYKGWQEKGRQVRKGEKAIWLCMPLTRKKKNSEIIKLRFLNVLPLMWCLASLLQLGLWAPTGRV